VANALPLPSPVQLTQQSVERFVVRPLLQIVEVAAAVLLVADLVVVVCSVLSRFLFDDPLVWSDDVARALLLAVCFLGAAAALAHGENAGVTYFVDHLGPRRRRKVDAIVALTIALVAAALCWNALLLLRETSGQTVGAGLPQELFIAPLCFAAGAMTIFAVHQLSRIRASTWWRPSRCLPSWPRVGWAGARLRQVPARSVDPDADRFSGCVDNRRSDRLRARAHDPRLYLERRHPAG